MKTEFSEKAFESELCELLNRFHADGNIKILFDWYDSSEHDWEYGSQSKFLRWVEKEEKSRAEKNNETPLSIVAIRKQYQRNQKLSPEQRAFRLKRKEKLRKKKESYSKEDPTYRPFANEFSWGVQSFLDPLNKKLYESIKASMHAINTVMYKSMQYTLNTTLISAYGIWINADTFRRPQMFFCEAPFLKEIFYDMIQAKLTSPETSDDLREPSRENRTIMPPPTRRGSFFVFAGSQMVKEAKTSGKSNEHINKKREELIDSGIVEEQGQFYVFKKNYPFSSPSMAASVLLGMNVNGQIYWRDHRGRTFKELHPKFDKIKRGPGRPKKFS